MLAAHPSSELYGSDRMFLESVVGLVEAGWRVVATLPHPGPLVAQLEAAGAEVRTLPSPVLRKAVLTPRGAVDLLRESVSSARRGFGIVRRADAVYVSTLTVPLWLVLARAARTPSLCHVHEAEGSAPSLLRHAVAAPLELASALAVNSEFARAVLTRSSRRSGRRARLVPNGVVGPPGAVPPREHLTGAVRVLYVGRLSPRKGVDVAVDAVALLAGRGLDVHLDLVGAVYPGYEWYEAELRAAVAQAGLGERVTFHGFYPDIWPFAATSDCVVVPSRADEPFGNTAVEAVLAQRPVVVSDTSGLREASAGYACAQAVTPGDPAALADAVARVVDQWPAYRAAASSDAEVAATRHSLAGYRSHVADLVGALAQNADRSPSAAASSAAEVLPPAASVTVAVLTYRRAAELGLLLPQLVSQVRSCGLRANVLVVDNDPDQSGRHVVEAASFPEVIYLSEPRPGIAAARNAALASAAEGSDLLAFIDDDEVPDGDWLQALVGTHARTRSAAVVGPVESSYRGEPGAWVVAGRFFDRRRLATGTAVEVAATNNLLLDLRQVAALGLRFDERFGLSGGSDTLFTRQLVRDGGRMVWCDEALVVDEVPVDRLTRRWVLQRALRSGNSWSRTSVELARTPSGLALTRAALTASGLTRVAGGAARAAIGYARRDMADQAMGARTLARGLGMAGGAWGWVYSEYRRATPAAPAPAAPTSGAVR